MESILYSLKMKINITALEKSKTEGKDQESMQSSIIPDPPFEINKDVLLKKYIISFLKN